MATERVLNIQLKAKDLFTKVTTKFQRTLLRTGRGMKKAFDVGRKAAQKAKAVIKKLGTAIKVVLGPISLLVSAFGVLSGAGLVLLIKNAANAADSLGKLSDRLKISVEFLSEMRFVADQTGVNVDALGVGIQRVTRRMSEFRSTGAGAGAVGFKLLGDEVREAVLAGESFEELLPKIADGFQKIENQQDRVSAAFSLFDSEGVSFIQFLQLGSEGVEKLRNRARELGGVIGTDAAQSAAVFNNALSEMTTALKGVRDAIGAGLFRTFAAKLKEITEFIVRNREAFVRFVVAVGKFGISVFGRLFDFIKAKLEAYRKNWRTALDDLGGGIKFVSQFLIDTFEAGAIAVGVVFTVLANKLPAIIQAAFTGFSFTDLLTTGSAFSTAKNGIIKEIESISDSIKAKKAELVSLQDFFDSGRARQALAIPFGGDLVVKAEQDLKNLIADIPALENDLASALKKGGFIGVDAVRNELSGAIQELRSGLGATSDKFGEDMAKNLGELFSGPDSKKLISGIVTDFEALQRAFEPGPGQSPRLYEQFISDGPQIYAAQANIKKGAKDVLDLTKDLVEENAKVATSYETIAVAATTFGQGFREQSDDIRDSITSLPQQGRDAAAGIFNALDEGFFQAMQGELRTLEDFFKSTFLSIASSIQRILSGALSGQLVGLFANLFGGGGTSNDIGGIGGAAGVQDLALDGFNLSGAQAGSFSANSSAGSGDINLNFNGDIMDPEGYFEKHGDKILRSVASAAGRNQTNRSTLTQVLGR